jgi:hypothetical protein
MHASRCRYRANAPCARVEKIGRRRRRSVSLCRVREVVSSTSESRLAGESASCAKGGLEGCSQAQVGLVWSGLCLGTGCKGGRVPTSVG